MAAIYNLVVDKLRKYVGTCRTYGAELERRGVIIVGLPGSGKTHLLNTLRAMGSVSTILSAEELYGDVYGDAELEEEETIKRILDRIRSAAGNSRCSFIALDNPDIPLSSRVTEEAALKFTRRLLEEAANGELPPIVVTLDEFTYRRFEKEGWMRKIVWRFDVVKLVWSSDDIERVLRVRKGSIVNTNKGRELLKTVAEFTRTPAGAIALFDKALTEDRPVLEILAEGLRRAFDEYIMLLAQAGYKLSKAKSKKWTEVWRTIVSDAKHRDLIEELMKRGGVNAKKLTEALGGDKASHWPETAAIKYHIIERPEALMYRFTDEFLTAAVGYATETPYIASLILKNMAKLYGEISTKKRRKEKKRKEKKEEEEKT